MKIGVVYPQIEFSSDPGAIREYAQIAEGAGYTHLLAYDHVLGADRDRYEGLTGPYTYRDPFQELFVLFSYLAGITQKLEFTTGIIILPQRQTALVAKQAATLDVLSGGRLRLGVGLGWNFVEYDALNENFKNRGRRVEEQVELLRLLWTQPLVNFTGRWHHVEYAGLNPLPIQQPIPIWFGGQAEAVLARTARLGDGWLPNYRIPSDAQPALDKLSQYLQGSGRSMDQFGIEARLHYSMGLDACKKLAHDWEEAGATHLSLNTMGCGFTTPAEHIEAIKIFASEIGLQ